MLELRTVNNLRGEMNELKCSHNFIKWKSSNEGLNGLLSILIGIEFV